MTGSPPAGVPISAGFVPGVSRLGLARVLETAASLGVSNTGEMRKGDVATALPAAIELGASFDPELAYAGGRMIGGEARAKGFGIMLAGGANLIRDPRAGRNFEYFSEDPLLSGVMAGRAIAGVQSNRIVSTLKHFALNDQETGRLTVTFPGSIEQLPHHRMPGADVPAPPKGPGSSPFLDKLPFTFSYPEGSDAGYRWFARTRAVPLYPFGHGLSYTTFRYRALKASGDKSVSATFKVTNTGHLEGSDVPQVYVTSPGRAKRLIGWQRVKLAPGETRTVTVHADPRLLADYDVGRGRWKVRSGLYKIELGASAADPLAQSRDVRLEEAYIDAKTWGTS